MAEETSSRFLFSSEVPYGCVQCGKCCTEQWRVPLDRPTRESLRQRDWRGTDFEKASENSRDFFIEEVPSLKSGAAFRRTERGCIFLGESGLCAVHKDFGSQAKGVVCRLFPYLFVEAPEGIYVGYSFCCEAVRKPRLIQQATEVTPERVEKTFEEARHLPESIHYARAPEWVLLADDVEIPWNSYLTLEKGLLELLYRKGQSPPGRLISGYYYLMLCSLFLKEFTEQDEKRNQERIEHFVEAMRQEHYVRVERMTQRGRRRWFLNRYVLSVMLSLHESGMRARKKRDEQGGYAAISRFDLLKTIFLHMLGRKPKPALDARTVGEKAIRYVRHVIWRKGLALGRNLYRLDGVCRQYAMLLVSYALIDYHANLLSASMEPEEAIDEAIRIVERDYVLHASRAVTGPAEEERSGYDLFVGLFDSLVGSKQFAPSMIRRR